jgi:hypothetical protein
MDCRVFTAHDRAARATARAAQLPDAVALPQGIDAAALQRLWATLQRVEYQPGWHRLIDLDFGTHDRTALGRWRTRLRVWWSAARAQGGAAAPRAWLRRFPAPFADALASVPDDGLEAAALAWRTACGFDALLPEVLMESLMALRHLARIAQADGGALFLRVGPGAG